MKATRLLARCLLLCLMPAFLLLLLAYAPVGLLISTATLTSFKVSASVAWQYDLAATGLTNPSTNTNSFTFADSTTNGTGASGTANLIYAVEVAIAGGGTSVANLNSSPVMDWFGATLVYARVKYFFVNLLTTTTATSISIGGGTDPIVNWISAGSSSIKLQNGGVWLQGFSDATGYAVTTTTADRLTITNNDGSNTATVNLCIVGSTA